MPQISKEEQLNGKDKQRKRNRQQEKRLLKIKTNNAIFIEDLIYYIYHNIKELFTLLQIIIEEIGNNDQLKFLLQLIQVFFDYSTILFYRIKRYWIYLMSVSVSAQEAIKLIAENASNPKFKIIDVQSPLKRAISFIPNSQHIPFDELQQKVNTFNKEDTYLIYCRSGKGSNTATKMLVSRGINAINLEGGMNEWEKQTKGTQI